ncbi:MAG: outer membrane beta-barrel protein [Bdellovibrionales bacterium]
MDSAESVISRIGQVTPNPAADEPTHNVTQAFVTYQATDRLSVMAGKFYTHIGFEVTRAKDNWQYSRSLLFNYGPFWQQGVGLTYILAPEKLTGTLYVINGWDGRTSQEGNRELSLGANLNYVGIPDLTLNYNYIGGRESPVAARPRRQLHEMNGLYKISDRYQAAIDVHHGTQSHLAGENQVSWWGAALYLKAQVTEMYSISPRYEYFDDSDAGLVLVGGFADASDVRQRVQAFHLTNSWNLGDGLETRFEVGVDQSDKNGFFLGRNRNADNRQQESYTLAVLYQF